MRLPPNRALVALENVPKRLNEARVLDLLEGLEAIDDEVTFLEGVFRLPPAHLLRVDAKGLERRRYWQFEPGPTLQLGSDAEYADAFKDVFTRAVHCRLRSVGTPAAMLSGGIDSGAVAAVAADLLGQERRGPLPTISATGPDPENRVESRLISLALETKGIAPKLIDYSNLDTLIPSLRTSLDDLEEPFEGYMTMIRAVYLTAAQDGRRVVLDGAGGDTTLHPGNVLQDVLQTGRFTEIVDHARNEAKWFEKRSAFWKTLLRAVWLASVPNCVRQWRSDTILRSKIRLRHRVSRASTMLIQKADLTARHKQYGAQFRRFGLTLQAERAAGMISNGVIVGRERYDRVAASAGVEPRDPFLDTRLLKFCLALPSDQLLRDGRRKHIMRNAMAGLVSDKIRWNRG